jgi:prevent-host-death family protein
MIATLKESKAHLSALVERASHGEEVIITVRGKPKACLCAIPQREPEPKRSAAWGRELREARETYSTGVGDSSSEIIDDLRQDRA